MTYFFKIKVGMSFIIKFRHKFGSGLSLHKFNLFGPTWLKYNIFLKYPYNFAWLWHGEIGRGQGWVGRIRVYAYKNGADSDLKPSTIG